LLALAGFNKALSQNKTGSRRSC